MNTHLQVKISYSWLCPGSPGNGAAAINFTNTMSEADMTSLQEA
jgi:hypothetical protein